MAYFAIPTIPDLTPPEGGWTVERLYERFAGYVLTVLRKRCYPDVDLAEDLAQNLWMKVCRCLPALLSREGQHFYAMSWIYKLTVNTHIDHCRTVKALRNGGGWRTMPIHEAWLLGSDADSEDGPHLVPGALIDPERTEDRILREEEAAPLRLAFAKLTEREREALYEHHVLGYGWRKLRGTERYATGKSIHAALRRARWRLKFALEHPDRPLVEATSRAPSGSLPRNISYDPIRRPNGESRPRPYRVRIKRGEKQLTIGFYATLEEAIVAKEEALAILGPVRSRAKFSLTAKTTTPADEAGVVAGAEG